MQKKKFGHSLRVSRPVGGAQRSPAQRQKATIMITTS